MAEPTANEARPLAEISHGPSALENFLDKNQKLLIAAGILIAVGTGAWVVYQGVEEGARKAGGEALSAAADISALEEVISSHADTPAAGSAAVLLSDRQWEDGQQEAAIETLRSEIAARPDHPASLPARARLGARLAAQGRNDDAATTFEGLLAQPESRYLAPYALTWLAQIAKEQGNAEQAEKYLAEATDNYPQNNLTSTAREADQFLHFEMPEAIDPPEPPPIDEESGTDSAGVDPTMGTGPSGNPLFDTLNADPVEDTESEAPAPPVEDEPEADRSADPSPPEDQAAEPQAADEPTPESGE